MITKILVCVAALFAIVAGIGFTIFALTGHSYSESAGGDALGGFVATVALIGIGRWFEKVFS